MGVDPKPWADARSETRSVAEYIMLSGFCKHEELWGELGDVQRGSVSRELVERGCGPEGVARAGSWR